MSSDEDSDTSASDIGDEDEVLDTDNDSDEDEEEFRERMENLEWKNKLLRSMKTKAKKKDIYRSSEKVLFRPPPSNLLDCFNKFFPEELKDLLLKYTNMKGECSAPVICSLVN